MNTPGAVAAAIHEWSEVLGKERVVTDDAARGRYGRTTQDHGTVPACILYPGSTEEVQAVVRTAGQHGVVLYPISAGKNWGYGDACAPTEGTAIVDLRRMNRIVEVNTDLAYAVIEAGVTQQQLYDHLRERRTGLWMDCTGAGPEASFVGNTLDRGFGHTRCADHFQNTCGMEIVLADGRVLNTSFGHYTGAKAAHVYPYGVGPYLDGLFCQSNFGIVTRIGMWLMPAPEAFTFFYVTADDPQALKPLIDRLRPLRLDGTLTSAVHIANDLRLLSATGRYPWEAAQGVTPLPEGLRAQMRRDGGLGYWNVAGSLTGSRAYVRAACKALRGAIGNAGKVRFIDDGKLALAQTLARGLRRIGLGAQLSEKLRTLEPNYGLLKGIPTTAPLLGPQWRLRTPPEGACDPLEAGCGLMWISPVLPMTGADAQAVVDLAVPILSAHGFDAPVTFTLLNQRSMVGILNVAFDKAIPEESAQAMACYDALAERLIAAGYIPYRTGLQGMAKLRKPGDVFWDVASRLKHALDPHDTIARGRYIPPQS